MGSQNDAHGPRRGGGPVDEEARWQAYQAWLRKQRGGFEPAPPGPPPVPVAEPPTPLAYVRYPSARTGLISLAALGIAGAMIGGISLLALGHAPSGPVIPAASVRAETDHPAKLGSVAPPPDVRPVAAMAAVAATPAPTRVDVPTVSERPAAAHRPVKARVRRRRWSAMGAHGRRRRLTPMEAYARSPRAVDRVQ